jgi:hypothetical protein
MRGLEISSFENSGNSSQFIIGEFHQVREIDTSFVAEFGESFSDNQTLAPALHNPGDIDETVACEGGKSLFTAVV